MMTVGLSTVVILNLLYSFTHSDGIPSGSVFFWGAYALMTASFYLDKQTYNQIISNAKPIQTYH